MKTALNTSRDLSALRALRGKKKPSHNLPVRLAATVFLVYALHFASNVVRETYLAISLGESLSIRVDEYVGLHPDLFQIEGRGVYINNNPGASMLGAVPYAIARPAIELLFRIKPELARPKPPSTYADPRPNRTIFMNAARERGLDVKLALAALSMHVGLMAPLAGLAAVLLFVFLRGRLNDERTALWFALLYAFGTPIFFRSAYLNQNAIIAHCVLLAFVLLAGAHDLSARLDRSARGKVVLAGSVLGVALLCDYSALSLLLTFGMWVLLVAWRSGGPGESLRSGLQFAFGAAGPIGLLLAYQWLAFGHPLLPAQHYMPDTQLSVHGWNGFALPTAELLWRNLLDPRYGLFVFSPMLAAAVLAPLAVRHKPVFTSDELAVLLGASAALYLFSSANHFALLQWNTGVRYLVPAAPLLFLPLVPVLLWLPPVLRILLIAPTIVISWCTAMVREDVPTSLTRVFTGGLELPFLTVLEKTAPAYAPFLEGGGSTLPVFAILVVLLWIIWRPVVR